VEREIALLLMKGYSHKAIARDRGRSERTVRQHAVAIYQKSGLGGRAELAAFFLEDLMLPGAATARHAVHLP
jgi:DNA-binding NarL/FixJ family response regulator